MEALTKQEQTIPAHVEPANPAQLLELAVSQNLDVEKLERLMQLQKAWEADKARKAFFDALARFQTIVPELRKSRAVKFNQTEYKYAPLSEIRRTIQESLNECGLTVRFEINDTEKEIKVTCIVTHAQGHSEQTTMTATPDNSGSKNPIQARGSAIQYLQRYTMIAALGLTTADTDTDGVMPDLSCDELHMVYMKLYNELVRIDSKYTAWSPDNWKQEPNAKLYARAIGEIKKKLNELR